MKFVNLQEISDYGLIGLTDTGQIWRHYRSTGRWHQLKDGLPTEMTEDSGESDYLIALGKIVAQLARKATTLSIKKDPDKFYVEAIRDVGTLKLASCSDPDLLVALDKTYHDENFQD